MNTNVQEFRQKYPVFIYQSYQHRLENNQLEIDFTFATPSDHTFTSHYTIPVSNPNYDKTTLDNLIFHLGLIESFSYWKATCSPTIQVAAGPLTPTQIAWWHDLLLNSMGEYFYQNGIDFTENNFLAITAQNATMSEVGSAQPSQKILVPIGGGKDSATTLELLKDQDITCFAVNPTPSIQKTIAASTKPSLIAARQLDPHLLKLNEQGYLNGHTPFSAMLAFLTTTVAYLNGFGQIALSNESSSNEGNAEYKGHAINHQYSKTFDFEQKFTRYSSEYLVQNSNYFSFLRPVNELQIAKIFSKAATYHRTTTSCNKNQKQGTWCMACPKCMSTYLALSPFMSQDQLQEIFGGNPLENPANQDLLAKLLFPELEKPFECVATHEEMRAAAIATNLSLDKLKQYSTRPLEALLKEWNSQNLVPQNLQSILKAAL